MELTKVQKGPVLLAVRGMNPPAVVQNAFPKADVIAFLALIVAMSAYLAVIRLRLIDTIAKTDPLDVARKRKLKELSGWLTFADLPLIVSAVAFFFYGFWDFTVGLIVGGAAPPELLVFSIVLFAIAGVVMIAHHL